MEIMNYSKVSMLLTKANYIKWLIVATLIIKSALLLSYGNFESMNSDEERNYQIASNFIEGKGYTINGEITAWHGSATVVIYENIINYKVKKSAYIVFVHILSIFIFLVSILFFYKIIKMSGISDDVLSAIAVLIYCVYPSNLLYIGNLFLYEKITLPLLIIVFYFLLDMVRNRKTSNYAYIIVPIIVSASCLLRTSMILIYFIIFISFLFYSLTSSSAVNSFKKQLIIAILTAVLLISSHIPLFQKNYTMFGSYIISTQSGYELMQGHNDMARGSWLGNHDVGLYSYNDYSKDVIKNIEGMDEYEEGVARGQYAINWIKSNPFKELELIARKLVIFMLPKNYMGGYNVITILVHILFVISLILALAKRRIDSMTLLFLSPIVGSLLLSLIFFVGYRWRYYAEPFFILILFYQLSAYFPIFSSTKKTR